MCHHSRLELFMVKIKDSIICIILAHTCAMVLMYRSEDNIKRSWFSIMYPRSQRLNSDLNRLGSKYS